METRNSILPEFRVLHPKVCGQTYLLLSRDLPVDRVRNSVLDGRSMSVERNKDLEACTCHISRGVGRFNDHVVNAAIEAFVPFCPQEHDRPTWKDHHVLSRIAIGVALGVVRLIAGYLFDGYRAFEM